MSEPMSPRKVLEHVIIRALHDDVITAHLGLHVRVNEKTSDNLLKDARYKLWQALYEPLFLQVQDYKYAKRGTVDEIIEQLKPPI